MAMYDYTKKLERQRAELLAALKDIHATMIDGMTRYKWEQAFLIADKAIAKIEGEK